MDWTLRFRLISFQEALLNAREIARAKAHAIDQAVGVQDGRGRAERSSFVGGALLMSPTRRLLRRSLPIAS